MASDTDIVDVTTRCQASAVHTHPALPNPPDPAAAGRQKGRPQADRLWDTGCGLLEMVSTRRGWNAELVRVPTAWR